jgi:hypothetical protein
MPDAGSGEAHDHCALSIDRRDACVWIVAPLLSAPLGEAPHGVTRGDAFVAADTSRFRLAPKNSPPA